MPRSSSSATAPEPSPASTAAVTVDVTAFEAPAPEPKRKYLIGTTRRSPFQNVTLGGVTFQRYVGNFEQRDGSVDPRVPMGAVVELDDSKVELIKTAVVKGVVRTRGSHHVKLDSSSKFFKAMAGDEPLARFVYMVPLEDDGRRPAGEPTPMTGEVPEVAAAAAA